MHKKKYKQKVFLSIVTIVHSDTDALGKTCSSIDRQNNKCFEHIIVASGINDSQKTMLVKHLHTDNRKFIINEDTSLYNAMNIGINAARGNCILFLNGGDEFYTIESIQNIYKLWKPKTCMAFRTIQYYEGDKYIRPSLKKLSSLKNKPGHQGFVAPIHKKNIYYDESKTINADGYWMRKNIQVYGLTTSSIVLSKFSLGGVSNFPSLYSIKRYAQANQYKKIPNEIIKIVFRLLLGVRMHYKILALIKSYEKV